MTGRLCLRAGCISPAPSCPAWQQRWPIHVDHCFMRVCWDCALGQAWPQVLRAPAIRSASDLQLAAAIAVAEGIVAAPETLASLNVRSLAMRKVPRKTSRDTDAPSARYV